MRHCASLILLMFETTHNLAHGIHNLFGICVDKDVMARNRLFSNKNCCSTFVKIDVAQLNDSFFKECHDKDCNRETYDTNYWKQMDGQMKKVAIKYHNSPDLLRVSPEPDASHSKFICLYMNLKPSLIDVILPFYILTFYCLQKDNRHFPVVH